jgi:hypothetical protein
MRQQREVGVSAANDDQLFFHGDPRKPTRVLTGAFFLYCLQFALRVPGPVPYHPLRRNDAALTIALCCGKCRRSSFLKKAYYKHEKMATSAKELPQKNYAPAFFPENAML